MPKAAKVVMYFRGVLMLVQPRLRHGACRYVRSIGELKHCHRIIHRVPQIESISMRRGIFGELEAKADSPSITVFDTS